MGNSVPIIPSGFLSQVEGFPEDYPVGVTPFLGGRDFPGFLGY